MTPGVAIYECCICLCDCTTDDSYTTRCYHAFHKLCIYKWFEMGGKTCPVCRTDLSASASCVSDTGYFRRMTNELNAIIQSIESMDTSEVYDMTVAYMRSRIIQMKLERLRMMENELSRINSINTI